MTGYSVTSYNEAIDLFKKEVEQKPRGFLKEICKTNNFSYHAVVGLKNNTLKNTVPTLLLDVFAALDFECRMVHDVKSLGVRKHEESITYFLKKL